MRLRGAVYGMVWLGVFLVLCWMPGPAFADDTYWGMVDAPDWGTSEGYTRQSWGFSTKPDWEEDDGYLVLNGKGYEADYAVTNTYGTPVFVRTGFSGSSGRWSWSDEGPMNQDWEGFQGLVGGMGSGTLDFKIWTQVPSGYTQEIWIQYVVYVSTGSAVTGKNNKIASDSNFTALLSNWEKDKETNIQIEALDDQGSGGNWYRITQLWQIGNPQSIEYIRIATDTEGFFNMVDSVDIITRAVDNKPPVVSATSHLSCGQ